jgi:replicative DNA helicase
MEAVPSAGLLPHDKEAEQGVLGAILHDNDAFHQVADILGPDCFFSPAHRELFKAMQGLHEQQDPIDELTVGNFLKSRNRLEQVGGPLYILELLDLTPVTANVLVYADIVREKFQLRQLIDAATEIAAKGRESSEDVPGLIQKAESVFLELSTNAVRHRYSRLKDILISNFKKLEEMTTLDDGLIGLPSGFAELDRMTNGFQPSDLIVLASRPSMGKTSLALNIAKFGAIARKKPVLIFTLEMSKEQLAKRLLCSEAGVDSQKLDVSNLDEFEWDKLAAAAGKLSEVNMFIDETPEVTPLTIKAIARRIEAEHGLGMIVVDYMQLMRSSSRTDNREQEVADISRGLKAVAKELNVPVLACAQLNRALEARTDKRPHLSDLRESGAIEQDADIVMFIYRDEVYHPETEDQGIAEISIAKHRNGPITTRPIRLAFIPVFTKFANLSLREDEQPFN